MSVPFPCDHCACRDFTYKSEDNFIKCDAFEVEFYPLIVTNGTTYDLILPTYWHGKVAMASTGKCECFKRRKEAE